jgi:hypothetical protein
MTSDHLDKRGWALRQQHYGNAADNDDHASEPQ